MDAERGGNKGMAVRNRWRCMEGVLPGLYFLDNFRGSLALLWCSVHRRLHAGKVITIILIAVMVVCT